MCNRAHAKCTHYLTGDEFVNLASKSSWDDCRAEEAAGSSSIDMLAPQSQKWSLRLTLYLNSDKLHILD